MKHFYFGAIALSVGLGLSACGGGGSGGGGRVGPQTMAPPVSGPTASEVREEIANIGFAATSLTMSDLITTPGSRVFPNSRVEPNCAGTLCSPEPQYGEPGYSAAELSTINQDATLRIGETKYGINNGELSGRVVYRDPEPGGEDFSIDYRVYGGWVSENFFGVEHHRWRGRGLYGSVEGLETLIAYSAGRASESNPVMGSAEWNGLMVALDRTAPMRPVNGQAALTFDFTDQTLDVEFSEIRGARTYADMTWNDLAVVGGRFSEGVDSNSLSGSFYGDNHEEVGGVFERNQLIGAFGATR